jgi:predicted CoA-substrate-specific enzyme activase
MIIDIGGQDSKIIQVARGGKVLNFAMNDRCAAGTGRFIEIVAETLDVTLEESGLLALGGTEACEISSMCAVFAESEIVGFVQSGVPRETILRGVFRSVARRIVNLMGRMCGAGRIAFTGGVAKNPGVAAALREETGKEVVVPPEPQLTGALGAAIVSSRAAAGTRRIG